MSLSPLPKFSLFWSNKDDWPLDTPEAVFFGRALDQIGAALQPEWDGREFGICPAPILPPWPAPYPMGRGRPGNDLIFAALTVLWEHDPGYTLPQEAIPKIATDAPTPPPSLARPYAWRAPKVEPPPCPPPLEPPPLPRPSMPEAYAHAQKIAALVQRANEPYLVRAQQLATGVMQACVNRELVTAYRSEKSGKLFYCGESREDGSWWNTSRQQCWTRFTHCKIDRRNPTQPPLNKSSPVEVCWLYVERSSLEAFLRTIPKATKEYWPNGRSPARWVADPLVVHEARARMGVSKTLPQARRVLAEIWNEQPGTPRKEATFEKLLQAADIRAMYLAQEPARKAREDDPE